LTALSGDAILLVRDKKPLSEEGGGRLLMRLEVYYEGDYEVINRVIHER
jgi:hypothetical protein